MKRLSNAAGPRGTIKTRRLVDRLVPLGAILIFVVAVIVLIDQFRDVAISEVFAFFRTMPKRQIAEATGLTAASYLLLTGYDVLALRYVDRRLRYRDVIFISFTAFAFSNTFGLQLLSGGSTRYRLYSNFGLQSAEILGVVGFCTFTYALGVIAVGGIVFSLEPGHVASLLGIPEALIVAAGLLMLGFVVIYLIIAAIWHGRFVWRGLRLSPPNFSLAVAQVMLASIDAVLAGTVFYVLMPAQYQISFQSYLGVYLIAATTSVLSLVPGGLGVFETAITLLTAVPSKAAVLGVFLVYRIIYFLIPFIVALVWFALHEMKHMTTTGNH